VELANKAACHASLHFVIFNLSTI